MVRFDIPTCDSGDVAVLCELLGVSDALAQTLVRRGFSDPLRARAFLAADERHELDAFAGLREAAGLVLASARAGRRITIHGDYDVDGVCSTAILVRTLRMLGARVDWFLPDRADGYGLSAATVQAACPARDGAAHHGRLRDHRGRGGRPGRLVGDRDDRQRSSSAAGRRQVAGRPDRASCAVRLSLRGAVRGSGGPQARRSGSGGGWTRAQRGRGGSRSGRLGDDRRRGAADRREPQPGATRPA